jgi:hypothetical protein
MLVESIYKKKNSAFWYTNVIPELKNLSTSTNS